MNLNAPVKSMLAAGWPMCNLKYFNFEDILLSVGRFGGSVPFIVFGFVNVYKFLRL